MLKTIEYASHGSGEKEIHHTSPKKVANGPKKFPKYLFESEFV